MKKFLVISAAVATALGVGTLLAATLLKDRLEISINFEFEDEDDLPDSDVPKKPPTADASAQNEQQKPATGEGNEEA